MAAKGAVASILFPNDPVVRRKVTVRGLSVAQTCAVAAGMGAACLGVGYWAGASRVEVRTVEVVREVRVADPVVVASHAPPAPIEPSPAPVVAAEPTGAEPRPSRTEGKTAVASATRTARSSAETRSEASAPGATPGKPQDELESLLAGALTSKETGAGAKKDAPKRDTGSGDVDLATGLTKQQIQSAMAAVQPKVRACALQNSVEGQGMVEVRLTIAPSGRVTTARAAGKFKDAPVGACVAAAVKGAAFPSFVGDPQPVSYVLPLR